MYLYPESHNVQLVRFSHVHYRICCVYSYMLCTNEHRFHVFFLTVCFYSFASNSYLLVNFNSHVLFKSLPHLYRPTFMYSSHECSAIHYQDDCLLIYLWHTINNQHCSLSVPLVLYLQNSDFPLIINLFHCNRCGFIVIPSLWGYLIFICKLHTLKNVDMTSKVLNICIITWLYTVTIGLQ